MKTLYVIGGMGSGKSSAASVLAECGVPCVDLDKVGHDVHGRQSAKSALACEFGSDIVCADGSLDRAKLAQRAFENPDRTEALNRIMLPCIEESLLSLLADCEERGARAVVVECSAFCSRQGLIERHADVVLAVTAPIEERVARAVAAGWEESDVRRRIACQISDEQRAAAADAVFDNSGTVDELHANVLAWWSEFEKTL